MNLRFIVLLQYIHICIYSASLESPLLWLRADPELEYLAELNLLQPEHMWVGLHSYSLLPPVVASSPVLSG